MAKKEFRFSGGSYQKGSVKVKISLRRFEKQFKTAQFWLDGQVMTDMVPFMPHRAGTFIQQTRVASAALQGSGTVIAGVGPHGNFLYEGKVMIDPVTKSPWARKGAKKTVTDRLLDYNKVSNPDAGSHWFNYAKKRYGGMWVKGVKKRAGGE